MPQPSNCVLLSLGHASCKMFMNFSMFVMLLSNVGKNMWLSVFNNKKRKSKKQLFFFLHYFKSLHEAQTSLETPHSRNYQHDTEKLKLSRLWPALHRRNMEVSVAVYLVDGGLFCQAKNSSDLSWEKMDRNSGCLACGFIHLVTSI